MVLDNPKKKKKSIDTKKLASIIEKFISDSKKAKSKKRKAKKSKSKKGNSRLRKVMKTARKFYKDGYDMSEALQMAWAEI